MCRSTDYHRFNPVNRLKIRSFAVGFSGFYAGKPLPQSLTLVYLPRINENALEVSGSKIRPDSQAFVTLHRGVAGNGEEVSFGSRDRVVVSEGVRFEVYLGEEKVLKGSFRKDEEDEWRLECRCAMERDIDGAAAADVRVSAEGGVMREKVAMAVERRRRRRWYGRGLEEIPEEREDRCECDCGGSGGGDLGSGWDDEMDGGDEEGIEMDMDMEGVRWAVDVGIWVMCLGVGFLVSKASSKTLRRRKLI